jgi:hypothetical protein
LPVRGILWHLSKRSSAVPPLGCRISREVESVPEAVPNQTAPIRRRAWLVDEKIVRVLKIIRKFVGRLIQLNVIRPGHDHHDDAAVLALLDRTPELRSFRSQLAHGCIDVVAH